MATATTVGFRAPRPSQQQASTMSAQMRHSKAGIAPTTLAQMSRASGPVRAGGVESVQTRVGVKVPLRATSTTGTAGTVVPPAPARSSTLTSAATLRRSAATSTLTRETTTPRVQLSRPAAYASPTLLAAAPARRPVAAATPAAPTRTIPSSATTTTASPLVPLHRTSAPSSASRRLLSRSSGVSDLPRAAPSAAPISSASTSHSTDSRLSSLPARATRVASLARDSSASSLRTLTRVGSAVRRPPAAVGSAASGSTRSSQLGASPSSVSITSPNVRRRLSGVPNTSSASPAASSYSSGIAQLERSYQRQAVQVPATSSRQREHADLARSAVGLSTAASPPSVASRTQSASSAASSSTSSTSAASSSSFSSASTPPSFARDAPPAPTEFSVLPADGWSCARCTYHNSDRVARCDMCETPRVPSLSSPPDQSPSASRATSFTSHPPDTSTPAFGASSSSSSSSVGAASLSVHEQARLIRAEWRANMLQRQTAHEHRATDAMSTEAATRAATQVHPLDGLDPAHISAVIHSGGGASSSSSSTYPYADRGAQLATLARQGARRMSPSSSRSSLSSASSALEPLDDDDLASGPPLRAHERETASQAYRRMQRFSNNGAWESPQRGDSSLDDTGVPDLETPRPRTIASVHARVNRLQRQIDDQMQEIERSRARPNPPRHGAADFADDLSDGDERNHSDSDDYASSDHEIESASAPSAVPTASASSSSASAASHIPPPRAAARVHTTFTPYVSAADRLRAEIESMSPASSHSSSSRPAAPSGVAVGSLHVRVDRADSLRREMQFLSSLFDSVRSYQANLVQSLHSAGYVDDQDMARLPGLHVGLVHFLIESAWSAAARAAGSDAANGFAEAEPTLPPGHAARVEAMPTRTRTTPATDDCCICLEAMGVGSQVSEVECPAKHSFHTGCIRTWLARANTCPLCKRTAIQHETEQAQGDQQT